MFEQAAPDSIAFSGSVLQLNHALLNHHGFELAVCAVPVDHIDADWQVRVFKRDFQAADGAQGEWLWLDDGQVKVRILAGCACRP